MTRVHGGGDLMENEHNSILISIKKLLGLTEAYTQFDTDVIMHINTVFMVLNQLGVGPTEGFKISNAETTWDDYLKSDTDLEAVKTFMYLNVKLYFDPPQSSTLMDSINRQIEMLSFRLNVNADKGEGV